MRTKRAVKKKTAVNNQNKLLKRMMNNLDLDLMDRRWYLHMCCSLINLILLKDLRWRMNQEKNPIERMIKMIKQVIMN